MISGDKRTMALWKEYSTISGKMHTRAGAEKLAKSPFEYLARLNPLIQKENILGGRLASKYYDAKEYYDRLADSKKTTAATAN
jgi:hypothetical protein